jgi:hypothetical protein
MSDALFLLATVYRIVYSILGSYIIAWLAPDRPMGHALIGGILGFSREHCGGSSNMESCAVVGTALVSIGARGNCHSVRLAGRQAARDAVAHALTVDVCRVGSPGVKHRTQVEARRQPQV